MSSDSDIFETSEESGTDETETSDNDGTDESSGFDPNVSDDDGTDEASESEAVGSDEESGFDPNVTENDEASEIEASEAEEEVNLNDITTVIPSEILIANPFLTAPDNQTTQVQIEAPAVVSGQTLTQLSESLQPQKVKRTILPTMDRDLANLEKAARLAEVKVVLEGLPITGNINIDLKLHANETIHQFDVRAKITQALIAPPYNVSIKAALIAGKIWCQKALYGVVYPEDIENSLREIQLRGT